MCNKEDGSSVTLTQYLGIKTIDDINYFVTWHTNAISDLGIKCDYPQLIQHSMEHDFGL